MRTAALAALLLLGGCASPAPRTLPHPEGPRPSPREQVSIDAGWRFTLGDQPGNTVSLLYDVRPEMREPGPAQAPSPSPPLPQVLKPWILPSGNAFIVDPTKRFAAPPEPWQGDVAYLRSDFDDSSWQRVDLPHDWAIAGPFITTGNSGGMGRLPSWGVGWYRRQLDIPAGDAGRSIFLDVDGAMSYAAVWLNGRLVGGWPYGYSSWRLDLTPYVVPGGTNQLAIRLDNPPSSSRWYPGGGIYRHVWLTKTEPLHVAHWGTYLTTPDVSPAAATVRLAVTVANDAQAAATVRVATKVFALDSLGRRTGGEVASIPPAETQVSVHGTATVHGEVTIADPRRWGPPPGQVPHRYVAVTTVAHDGRVTDSYETRFGIRSLRFDADSGVFVNGRRVYLQGVNNHHDLGALGAAFNRRAAERQLELLRAMGANALRTSHNPPAPELLELADSLGFLVFDEAFDAWYRQKTPLDFHLVFADWHEQDLRAMLRRDRNHPSVILWSIGNEVGEQMTGDAGVPPARELAAIVKQEDPTRPTTMAMNWSQPQQPFTATVDVISLNYQGIGIRTSPGRYPEFHAQFPDRVVLSSESAAALSSRGEYQFPVASAVSNPVRPGQGGDTLTHHVSAYELYAADFGTSADRVFAAQQRNPYVAGEFVWSGWDYLGEPTPYYSARSSYFGIIDLAGFPKDRFYLYQSVWRPELPMAHILPHWTWPERVRQVTPVHVFTSGDAAELFLNGRSLGRKQKGEYEYRLRWDSVVYEPGTLEVVSYRNGREWAKDVVKTAGEAAALQLRPDRSVIAADGRDLSFITVRVVDAAGVLAPRANHRIRFSIEGPGEIVATDNGDPTSFVPFPSPERSAFNGLALAIVRAQPGQTGPITVTASAAGLKPAVARITATGVNR